MKCCFCGAELQHWDEDFLYCANLGCPMSPQIELPISIWQALISGKKAQDALKVAIDALSKIDAFNCHSKGAMEVIAGMATIANRALYKITSNKTGGIRYEQRAVSILPI